MAGVYVGYMLCKESSDAADDIYIIVFRGNTTPPFYSNVGVHGPGNFWDDFDAGEPRNQDIGIAYYRPDAVYVVQLVDRDGASDIDSTALGLWKTWTDLAWKSVMISQTAANLPTSAEPQRVAAAGAIINAFAGATDATMRFPKNPDDVIGPAQRLVISPGQKPPLFFKERDGEGHYKVIFKIM